jgi:hypothetical protein
MFSYIVGLIACLVMFYNPISQLLSQDAVPQMRRMARPQLNTELLALEETAANGTGITCPRDAYSVHIYSREPLVLYIEGFLSVEERAHLLEIRWVTFPWCISVGLLACYSCGMSPGGTVIARQISSQEHMLIRPK